MTRKRRRSDPRKTRQREFAMVQEHMQRLFLSFEPPLRDSLGTLTVDTADLFQKCASTRRNLLSLLRTPILEANLDRLRHQVVALQVAVDDLKAIASDLQVPLHRLGSALYREGRFKVKPKAGRLTPACRRRPLRGRA